MELMQTLYLLRLLLTGAAPLTSPLLPLPSRRVNIGMELVVKPSILYMDEPTSGLDAAVALEVLTSLARMADAGVNVVCVIHQPRWVPAAAHPAGLSRNAACLVA